MKNIPKAVLVLWVSIGGIWLILEIAGYLGFSLFQNQKWIGLGAFMILALLITLIILYRSGYLIIKIKSNKAVAEELNDEYKFKVYSRSDSSKFHEYASNLMHHSSRVVLIGTGLNILHHDPLRVEIMERAKKEDCFLEIYLADPRSPSIKDRLIEEETGNDKPPVGYNGLMRRLNTLLNSWEVLGKPNNIRISLFSNYPTFALLIIDSTYFMYPYGFAKLGNYSPVLEFSRKDTASKEMIHFLDEQFKNIKKSSINAYEALNTKTKVWNRDKVNELKLFAVYFIPAEDSKIYDFGSKILGFDVRKSEEKPSKWEPMVGGAAMYGFHLTLCDALYFHNDFEVDRAMAEVEFLSEKIKHFEFTNLKICANFPNPKSVSLSVEDQSGGLEILHNEIVNGIYKRALGSNYSLGLVNMDRDKNLQRAKLITKYYNAPYILNRYDPHFTLLTNVPAKQKVRVRKELEALFLKEVGDSSVRVDKIAIMYFDKGNQVWKIKKEIELR